MCISGDFICSYRENKMVCDCEYAKMGEQMANEVEQMTLDERKQMAQKREEPSLMESIWGKKDTSQFKYENCSCFMVDRLDEICYDCVPLCYATAREAFYDREEEAEWEKKMKEKEEEEREWERKREEWNERERERKRKEEEEYERERKRKEEEEYEQGRKAGKGRRVKKGRKGRKGRVAREFERRMAMVKPERREIMERFFVGIDGTDGKTFKITLR